MTAGLTLIVEEDGSIRIEVGLETFDLQPTFTADQPKEKSEELLREIALRSARCAAARTYGFPLAKPAGDCSQLGSNMTEAAVERGAVDGGDGRGAALKFERLQLLVDLGDESLEDLVRLLLLRLELAETRLNLLDSLVGVSHSDWSLLELSEYLELPA